MKDFKKHTTIVFIIMTVLFLYGIICKRYDWMQIMALSFSVYWLIVIANALFNGNEISVKNEFYRPFVSILIPARNEENVIAKTVLSLSRIKYFKKGDKHFEIIVIDDGSTDLTGKILKDLMGSVNELKIVTIPEDESGKGKSRALNIALEHAQGEIIAVFDADSRVDEFFLKDAVSYLYDDRVAGVQARVRIYNAGENMVSGFQEDEFAVYSHLLQTGRQAIGGMTSLGGNGQIVKASALKKVNGWNEYSTTEDMDLTIRLTLEGYIIRYCHSSQVWQEGIEEFPRLIKQRTRWADGLLRCIFTYISSIITGKVEPMRKFDCFMGLVRVTVPMWIIVGYSYFIYAFVFKHELKSIIPFSVYNILSVSFFLVMLYGMFKTTGENILTCAVRVIRFWAGSFVWIIATPIALVNLFNSGDFYWDKTFHRGTCKINDIEEQEIQKEARAAQR